MKKIRIVGEPQRSQCEDILKRIPLDGSFEVTFREASKRSLEQNNLLWSMLTEISKQTTWHGIKLSPESWKELFSAGLKKSIVVPNLENNGFIVIGASTSKMTVKEFSALLELIRAFALEHNVKFTTSGDQYDTI